MFRKNCATCIFHGERAKIYSCNGGYLPGQIMLTIVSLLLTQLPSINSRPLERVAVAKISVSSNLPLFSRGHLFFSYFQLSRENYHPAGISRYELVS